MVVMFGMAKLGSRASKKVLFRLDSGAVITNSDPGAAADGAPAAVLLSAEDAFAKGFLRSEQLQRLESLVQTHSRVLDGSPPRSVSTGAKRKRGEAVLDSRPSERPGKAARQLEPGEPANGHHRRAPGAEAASTSAGGSSWAGGEFEGKCLEILAQVLADLGQDAPIFDRPVDPKIAPDYYTVVKNPVDLGAIKRRLERRTYQSPQDFAEELRRVWTNCHIYNKRDSYVGKVGARAAAYFEQLWAGSGYDTSQRHKRLGAGIAAQKYEPALESGDNKKAKKGLLGKGSQRTGGRGQELQRTQSTASRRKEMPQDRLQALANSLGSLDGQNLDGALVIIREGMPGLTNTGGEIEVDFNALDQETLWQLDEYIGALAGRRRGQRPPTQLPQEPESEYDSESEDGD